VRRQGWRREYQVVTYVDVAVCGFGIRTLLVSPSQRPGQLRAQPWQADVEASLQEVSRASCAQVHFVSMQIRRLAGLFLAATILIATGNG